MAQINVLSNQLANLIAAGEVVDRPASVAKELCENALDAGATQITIEIRGGGSALLRVTDNGCGMTAEDARRSVLRHATSKICTEEDLEAIGTLGFRGEALAAISAVSHFSILTKRAEEDFGHKLVFESGELVSEEEAGCPDGTTVIVSDLFYNQPARRKFLKRDATEQSALLQYMQRLSIAFPRVSFKCICEGAVKFQTPGDGKTLSAIRAVYGKDVSDTLFEVSYSLENLTVSGFVSRPENARPTRSLQCFYINSRYVKSKTMLFAMDDAFKSFLKSDRHPVAFLFLETDLSSVDVNVHPAKLEVRFSDERAVYRAVYAAIRSALTALSNPFHAPQAFEPETIPELPKSEQMRFRPLTPKAKASGLSVATPAAPKSPTDYRWSTAHLQTPPMTYEKAALFPESTPSPLEKANEIPKSPLQERFEVAPSSDPEKCEETAPLIPAVITEAEQAEVLKNNPLCDEGGKYLGAVFDSYLLYELEETLYVIDKHAAHERILYEGLKSSADPTHARQLLLSPVVIRLDAMEADAIASALSELDEIGFELSAFGENTFALRAIPVEFSTLGHEALSFAVEGFANEILRGGNVKERRRALWDKTLFTVACKAAMKAGRTDSEHDCIWIIEKLREIPNIFVCPHGRPIISSFDKRSFEKLFFRA